MGERKFSVRSYIPCSSVGKESACNAGDPGFIPGLGRSPGEGNGNPLQYSCLENPMDRGGRRATVNGVARVRYDLATKPPTIWEQLGFHMEKKMNFDPYFTVFAKINSRRITVLNVVIKSIKPPEVNREYLCKSF